MTILLDIDGVLVTTPAWRLPEILADGFMKFNDRAASNLQRLLIKTEADIILTTTHRINYSTDAWKNIFKLRGILTNSIAKINDKTSIQTIDLLQRVVYTNFVHEDFDSRLKNSSSVAFSGGV